MSWYIDPEINEGYPWNDEFPDEFATTWTVNDNIQLPKYAWRILEGVNDGYPFIWWWFQEDSAPSGGTMTIGGRQTNYPDGFNSANRSHLNSSVSHMEFVATSQPGILLRTMLNLKRMTPYGVKELRKYYTDKVEDLHQDTSLTILREAGIGLFDTVLSCKMFPFALRAAASLDTTRSITIVDHILTITLTENYFQNCEATVEILYFGECTPGVSQGWELEYIDWFIYLPYAGTFPIDIRSNEKLEIYCAVDIISGNAEYYVTSNGMIIFSTSAKMGIDVPFVNTTAQLTSNIIGWRNNQIFNGLNLVSSAVGAVNPIAGAALNAGVNLAKSFIPTSHTAISSPSIGSSLGTLTDRHAVLIQRVPKMYKNGIGYDTILGKSRPEKVDKLKSRHGFVRCENYKSDLIVATDPEKREIENLLNAGVFID